MAPTWADKCTETQCACNRYQGERFNNCWNCWKTNWSSVSKTPAPLSWKSVLNWIKEGDPPPHPPFAGDGFVEAFFVSFTAAATLSSSWALAALIFSLPRSFILILKWAEPAQDLLAFVITPVLGDWIPAYEWVCVHYQHTWASASHTFM